MNGPNTLLAAALNIEKGGFSLYDRSEPTPPKKERIHKVLTSLGADALTLTDVFRWNSHFGGNKGIARFLGMKSAFYTPLNDESLKEGNSEHSWELGVVFATNEKVAFSEAVDLDGRQINRTVLDTGQDGIQVISAYGHHKEEDIRIRQFRALKAQLLDMPTLMMTDANSLRPLETSRLAERARSKLSRFALKMLPSSLEIVETVAELERREALGVLLDDGFIDADPQQRPTVGHPALFGVDYILTRGDGISVSNVDVVSSQGASDHKIIIGDVHYR